MLVLPILHLPRTPRRRAGRVIVRTICRRPRQPFMAELTDFVIIRPGPAFRLRNCQHVFGIAVGQMAADVIVRLRDRDRVRGCQEGLVSLDNSKLQRSRLGRGFPHPILHHPCKFIDALIVGSVLCTH